MIHSLQQFDPVKKQWITIEDIETGDNDPLSFPAIAIVKSRMIKISEPTKFRVKMIQDPTYREWQLDPEEKK